MTLEIKGLRSKAQRMRQNIEALNRAYDGFNAKAPAHAADVEALTKQVAELGSDLDFAATALGNSTEQLNESEQEAVPKLQPVNIDAFPKRMNNL